MEPRIIVALDFPDAARALALSERLSPELCRVKVGKELFTAAGPALVATLARRGFAVFLDLKFHDIPNTVAQACRAAAGLGVWMLNVHALGGREMMEAARAALDGADRRPRLVAVTILTSLAREGLAEVGISGEPAEAALRLARLARQAGLDGVVCSAHEARLVRTACDESFLRVTPGIRLAEGPADDQKRVMTPRAAIEAGASYLVIGRPVTRAADPRAVVERIVREIESAESLG
ncbi:MAG TPA: orotidine-5'-phosphate decarboxylase [Burkholderiales bacterium]|jgi:orotidine-5'-phosphate decarboxylase|nr:orotidine-5'-phosphate decarboxylase [Burkholderiales bacterium]